MRVARRREPVTSVANPVTINTDHLSDAANEAWEQTNDRSAATPDGTYVAKSDRDRFRSHPHRSGSGEEPPFAAIGIGMPPAFFWSHVPR